MQTHIVNAGTQRAFIEALMKDLLTMSSSFAHLERKFKLFAASLSGPVLNRAPPPGVPPAPPQVSSVLPGQGQPTTAAVAGDEEFSMVSAFDFANCFSLSKRRSWQQHWQCSETVGT